MKKIVIIAGETSGDMHGAALAKSIKELNPAVELFGMGGDKMRESGVEIFFESPKLAVTGFIEVLKHLNKFKQVFRLVVEKLEEIHPDAVVLIDYPGFNLRLAKEVKSRDMEPTRASAKGEISPPSGGKVCGSLRRNTQAATTYPPLFPPKTLPGGSMPRSIKLFYYISPQVWAWGKGRIKTIRRFVDKMLVVFKFEENFYKAHNINAIFVGHPLVDIAAEYKNAPQEKRGIKIAVLPGSRENEIKHILPIMLKTSLILQEKIKDAEFMLATVSSIKKGTYQKIISRYAVKNLVLHNDKSYDCLWAADFALVCSGTATLETAIFGKPMAVIYKMSFLSYLIIKSLIKIPYIAMVNIVSGKKVVPEFIQFGARPKTIADYALKILNDPSARGKIETELAEVKKKLGDSGAARRAAEVILGEMEN